HPLAKYRAEVELFGTRTTATLGQWSDQRVAIAALVTAVKRQISKRSGAEYARLTLEDFHGTAEALVFPEAWAKLNDVIHAGPAPVLLEYGGNGTQARLRSRSLRVAVADDLLAALRDLLGAERVQLVKAT